MLDNRPVWVFVDDPRSCADDYARARGARVAILATMPTRRLVITVAGVTALYALALRPRLLRSGATDEEVSGEYPGAELLQGGKRGATMAVTVDAPPSAVCSLARLGL